MQQPPLEQKPTSRMPTPRPARFMQAACMAALLASGSAITGCRHQDAIDTTLDWTRSLRGGAIAEQRPPPPGRYDPFPKVGLTPTEVPEVPSSQARELLSEQLTRDRNLTYRTVAANGSMIPDIPPPPNAGGKAGGKKAQTTLPEGVSGAIMDAADTSPQQSARAPLRHAVSTVSTLPTETKATAPAPEEAEVAMPEVHKKADIPELRPDQIPQIPQSPPTAPSFPGFDVPSDAHLPDAVRPNYDLTDIKGTAFHFVPQSDQLSSGQEPELDKIVQKWSHGPLIIRGFGDAASMSAQDQSDAVRLGLLRAQRLATELGQRGIPASAITVRGDAFGTGAKVVVPPPAPTPPTDQPADQPDNR
ncbi:hypothetical protein [Acetobacter sp. LMG 32666]|uniref:hypothetical protein n=1 Tax=Acetobacter sp. LMG 32666 TaxID=2959295 RepID=UPI0030C802FD